MKIIQLNPPIEVHTPLGKGKAIILIDYGLDTNSVWKVVFYSDGSVRNFFDDQIFVYPNKMDGGNIEIPINYKK